MATFQQAQTGNRVYNGVSQSPNTGAVSAKGAQGYIRRELRRPVGRDGESDRRSGVAQQALGRYSAKSMVVNHYNGPSGGRPMTKQPKPKGPGGGGGPRPQVKPGNPVSTQPQQMQTPSVHVTADGQLQLPYNQDYAAALTGALNDANSQLAGLTDNLNAADLDYTTNLNQANRDYGSLQAKTKSTNASNGMLFSSRYGSAVANNADNYANQVGGLQSSNNLAHQTFANQQNSIIQGMNNQLAAAAQAYADKLNKDAGTLGYGRNPQHISPDKSTKSHQKGAKGSIRKGKK